MELNVFRVVVVGCKNVMRQGWDSKPCGQIFTPIGIAIQRFNHSATLPWCTKATKRTTLTRDIDFEKREESRCRLLCFDIMSGGGGGSCEGKIMAFLWYQISQSEGVFCIFLWMLNSSHTIHTCSLHMHSHIIHEDFRFLLWAITKSHFSHLDSVT